ncbi:TonB-dependent receptor plug domain-containing protein [Mariniflexile soesokkakense]|uniref:TonB-dependent receptor plug domain-containing protein n=1 Tax=Mariniflexile soesokkakense TaxID=1343160 RepID=A0ABV0AA91_9FLAO
MLNSLNRITKQLLKCFLVFFTTTILLNAQEKKSIPKIEKVYIHTDRTCYTLGESLWYKAYSVYAYNHILFNESNILYVELISPDSKIISRNKTPLENGLGHGDFKLTDSIGIKKPGTYQIRAYTNYSRNFGNDFVFEKEIEVIDVFEKQKEAKETAGKLKPRKADENVIGSSEKSPNIQFFPEGGSLVNSVQSVVAFKAVDDYGNPIKVEGKVFDANEELVAMFLSSHDGMGKFQMEPQAGKAYHAKVSISDGRLISVPLPKVNETGYLLSFKNVQGKDIITIKTNKETLTETPQALLTFVCTTRGASYFEGSLPLTSTTLSFELPKSEIADGITQITLYDANLRPQSERLVYIEKEHDLQVSVTTNKKVYKPLEQVMVNVSSKTSTGNLVPASFSLSCTDTNGQNDTKDYGTNISSYFLMESDIKGNVHNPSYYFDSSNPKRLYHLDLLLLTQGWRDFLWKEMPKMNDTIYYKPEKGFTVSGRVKQLFGNKPKINSNMTLALMGKTGINIFDTQTDSLGIFKFENLMFYGTTNMFLNSKDDKGKGKGEIIAFPFEQNPMPVEFKKQSTSIPLITEIIKETMLKKYVNYGIAPENILDEVEIIAKKKNSTPSLYGIPDFSYVVGDETPVFNDIYQLIQYNIPGVIVDGDSIRFMRFNGAAHIILDGFPINDSSQINFILPDNVEKIDAIKGPSAAIFGSEGANGVIAIYTKDPTANVQSKKEYHNINQRIEGFYDARVFYSPDPNKPSLEMDNTDAVRNTLFWNPYVHPDQTGTSRATYYNSKVETTVKVTLEGITATGIPVVVKTDYIIKN